MKIAITATETSLDAIVDPRFGRCPCFLIVDTDSMAFEAVGNPNVILGGGAGIQSAQLVADKGARYVLTGNCGPNAHRALTAAGITVIVGCSGPVRAVIERFKAGELQPSDQANVPSHFGVGSGSASADGPVPGQEPMPPGPGMGRGMGGGRGGGGGRGRGGGRRGTRSGGRGAGPGR